MSIYAKSDLDSISEENILKSCRKMGYDIVTFRQEG